MTTVELRLLLSQISEQATAVLSTPAASLAQPVIPPSTAELVQDLGALATLLSKHAIAFSLAMKPPLTLPAAIKMAKEMDGQLKKLEVVRAAAEGSMGVGKEVAALLHPMLSALSLLASVASTSLKNQAARQQVLQQAELLARACDAAKEVSKNEGEAVRRKWAEAKEVVEDVVRQLEGDLADAEEDADEGNKARKQGLEDGVKLFKRVVELLNRLSAASAAGKITEAAALRTLDLLPQLGEKGDELAEVLEEEFEEEDVKDWEQDKKDKQREYDKIVGQLAALLPSKAKGSTTEQDELARHIAGLAIN